MPSRLELTELIRQNNREMNRRVLEIKEFLTDIEWEDASGFLKTQYEKFRILTNTKSKKRLATGNLSRMNKKKLADMIEHQNQFLSSKWSTKQGRLEAMEKARNTLARQRGMNLTQKGYLAYTKLLSDETIGTILTEVHIDSDDIIKLERSLDVYAQEQLFNTFDYIGKNFDVSGLESLEVLNLAEIISNVIYDPYMTLEDLDEAVRVSGTGGAFYEDIRERATRQQI